MTGDTFQSSFLQEMRQGLVKSCGRARSLAGTLNTDQLNWKPSDDKWSIAQCLEHTLVGADLYAEKLRPAVQRARDKRVCSAGDVRAGHTVMGRLVLRAVEPTAKRTMTSPKIFTPAQSRLDDGVVDRFIRSHEQIAQLLSDCDGLDLSRVRLSSPVARIIRINAADAFAILVAHAERHLNQAQRVRESWNFPA